MNANVKKLVDALRNGEYSQAHSVLRNESGYCCLGVACEIYRKETGNGKWEPRSGCYQGSYEFVVQDPNFGEDTEPFWSSYYLPHPVMRWLGWGSERGSWASHESSANLASLNDNGVEFAQIADAIEEHDEALSKPKYV